jgi:hypothetical protein
MGTQLEICARGEGVDGYEVSPIPDLEKLAKAGGVKTTKQNYRWRKVLFGGLSYHPRQSLRLLLIRRLIVVQTCGVSVDRQPGRHSLSAE